MSKFQSAFVLGVLIAVVGCGKASSSDAGVDSGPPPYDAGHPYDAGPYDAGHPYDAGPMYGPESCSGIANCVENLSPVTVGGAEACAATGTADAGAVFGPLFECAMDCASVADAGGCLDALVSEPDSDGGCMSEYESCEVQGLGCLSILLCIKEGTYAEEECVLEGTATAIGKAKTLFGCVEEQCPGADAGCESAAISADAGGKCVSDLEKCEADTSAHP